MQDIWKFLGSKKLAVYMLVILVAVLFASTMFPSDVTFTAAQWADLQQRSPVKYWMASNLATPYLVKSLPFILLSLFLFLSTLVCTISRLKTWVRLRRTEFEKTKAFTFQRQTTLQESMEVVNSKLAEVLGRGGWDFQIEEGVIGAQKGLRVGFWGSVLFHIGLLTCFLAAPITAFSLFNGTMVLTDNIPVSFRDAVMYTTGNELPVSNLPDVQVRVHDLKGVYAEGKYKVDFGGRIDIDGWDVPFGVNKPVDYHGLQIGIHEFGFSPNVVIEKNGRTEFDDFLNLYNPEAGDYYPFKKEGLEMFILLFPDFSRNGSMLSSKSKNPDNPVLLVKFMKDGKPLHKGLLLGLGEEQQFDGYTVRFAELRNWVSMVVAKGWGITVIAVGFLIGIPALFIRFLSNERRLEFVLAEVDSGGTEITVRGYSRYYPAFLEREVNKMAEVLSQGEGE